MSSIDGSKIKLFQVRALVAVAEHGSFGKAAAELGMTQSAISHAIASLEETLGVALLFRGRHGATLSTVGTAIIDKARTILRELDAIVTVTQESRGLAIGQVRIAAIRSLATHWLPAVISTFKQRYPQITVTVTRCVNHGEVQATLHDGAADIGLMDIDDRTGLIVHEILADDYIALLPPDAVLPACALTWQDFHPYPLILPVPQDNSYRKLREYLAQIPIPLTIAYEVNEDSAIVSMVAEGLGMTILPHLAAIPIPPTVQVCPLPPPALQRTLGAVILADSLQSPPVFAFLETIETLSFCARLPK
jgi:DNA-binding transcriptional LysR family regulator